jgi:hypothetical protein
MIQQKGFFASLFDISFDSLITTKIIKVLYVLILIVIGIVSLILIATSFSQGGGSGVAAIIFVPIGALLYTIMARVYLEVLIILFKIGENTSKLVELQGGSPASGGAGGAPAAVSGPGGFGPPQAGQGQAGPPPQTQQLPPTQGQPPAGGGGGGEGTKAGWYPDPQGQKRLRFYDGDKWTEHTSD